MTTLRFRYKQPGGVVLWLAGISKTGTVLWMNDEQRAIRYSFPDKEDAQTVVAYLERAMDGAQIEAIEVPTVH